MRDRDEVKMEFQISPYEMRDEIGEIDLPSSIFQFSPLYCVLPFLLKCMCSDRSFVLDIHTGFNWIISVSEHLEVA